MPDALPSPYTPGEMATFTPGREGQQARLERLLAAVAGTSAFQGRIHVLQGSRGVGKTSLLRAMERRASALGLTTVFVTAAETQGLSLIGDELARHIEDLEPKTLTDQLRDRITKVGIKAGPLEVSADIAAFSAPPGAVANLRDAIAIVARSQSKARRGLAIFVDEIQQMPKADITTLATAWQELDAHTKKADESPIPATLIAAGLANSQEVITKAASFGERIRFDTLGNLSDDAAQRAVLEPSIKLDVRWTQSALDRLLTRASGYPYFIQLYAQEVWDVSRPRPGDCIEDEDVRAGIANSEPQVETFYRGRWNRATAKEREILLAIAQGGKEEMERKEIARRLHVKGSDLGMARASLLGKGLLAVPRRGVLSFNAPGFGQFILDEVEG